MHKKFGIVFLIKLAYIRTKRQRQTPKGKKFAKSNSQERRPKDDKKPKKKDNKPKETPPEPKPEVKQPQIAILQREKK